jgi:hypothetical protein
MMMHDLYSDMPELLEEPVNYATRLVRLWIRSDPALTVRCLECADDTTRIGIDRVADELRALVVGEALLVERHGLFFDLFTEGLREVQWSDLAVSFLEVTTEED